MLWKILTQLLKVYFQKFLEELMNKKINFKQLEIVFLLHKLYISLLLFFFFCLSLLISFFFQAKINHISGTKKATTVHSPSKYPEISNLLSYEPIFASVETQTVKRSSYKYQDSKVKNYLVHQTLNSKIFQNILKNLSIVSFNFL